MPRWKGYPKHRFGTGSHEQGQKILVLLKDKRCLLCYQHWMRANSYNTVFAQLRRLILFMLKYLANKNFLRDNNIIFRHTFCTTLFWTGAIAPSPTLRPSLMFMYTRFLPQCALFFWRHKLIFFWVRFAPTWFFFGILIFTFVFELRLFVRSVFKRIFWNCQLQITMANCCRLCEILFMEQASIKKENSSSKESCEKLTLTSWFTVNSYYWLIVRFRRQRNYGENVIRLKIIVIWKICKRRECQRSK